MAGEKDRKLYSVEAASGDQCNVGNWVVCKDGVSRRQKGAVSVPNTVNPTSALISDMFQGKILYGRIDNIEPLSEGDLGTVTISSSTLGRIRHPIHGMPMIRRNEGEYITLSSQVRISTHTSSMS